LEKELKNIEEKRKAKLESDKNRIVKV